MTQFRLALITLLLVLFTGCSAEKIGDTCYKDVYYFKSFEGYEKADTQEFRIMFTGEVANAYFYKNNRKYSTMDYYRVKQAGEWKEKITQYTKSTYTKCVTPDEEFE